MVFLLTAKFQGEIKEELIHGSSQRQKVSQVESIIQSVVHLVEYLYYNLKGNTLFYIHDPSDIMFGSQCQDGMILLSC